MAQSCTSRTPPPPSRAPPHGMADGGMRPAGTADAFICSGDELWDYAAAVPLIREAGGERFEYIPCLNADPEHITALAALIRDNLGGWTVAGAEPDTTAQLAAAAGAER